MTETKEYIEREAFGLELQNLVREYNKNCESDKSSGAFEALYRLRLAPAADVVEVVRCKDCKYAYINSFSAASGVVLCKKLSNEAETAIRQQDDYCSYGERKEEQE